MKQLFSPIGKTRFSFYIVLYLCVFSFTYFIINSYGLIDLQSVNATKNTTLLIFGLIIVILLTILFKRIRDLNNGKIIISLVYLLGTFVYFIPHFITSSLEYYIGSMSLVFIWILFNPIFPIGIILLLSFIKGKSDEDFNKNFALNKYTGILFFNKSVKEKVSNSRFLLGLYKYLFYVLLLFPIVLISIADNRSVIGYHLQNSIYNQKEIKYNEANNKYVGIYDEITENKNGKLQIYTNNGEDYYFSLYTSIDNVDWSGGDISGKLENNSENILNCPLKSRVKIKKHSTFFVY